MSAVCCCAPSVAFTLALWAMSALTEARSPALAASISGVPPVTGATLGSAPADSSLVNVRVFRLLAATHAAETPRSLTALTFARAAIRASGSLQVVAERGPVERSRAISLSRVDVACCQRSSDRRHISVARRRDKARLVRPKRDSGGNDEEYHRHDA